MLLELRADAVALTGDAAAAVRLYAAGPGPPPPRRDRLAHPGGDDRADAAGHRGTRPGRVEQAWQEGSGLTLDQLGTAVAEPVRT